MSRLGHAVAVVTLTWAFVPACGERAAEGGEAPAPNEAPMAKRAAEQPGTEPAPAPAAPAAEPVPAAEPPAPDTPAPAARSMRPADRAEPQGPTDEPRAARSMEQPPADRAQPAPTAPGAATEPCGEKGQPSCPLQGWMERHLQQPLDDGDLAKLAQGLARVPKFVPDPAWNAGAQGWSTIAEAAAAEAKQGDAAAVKQSCKTCHKAWRNKYKASFRLRPIPD